MHVRVRIFGKPDTIVVVESKLTNIEQFRRIIRDKFDIETKLQRLFYGGKLVSSTTKYFTTWYNFTVLFSHRLRLISCIVLLVNHL